MVLPWRSTDAALTECGLLAASYQTITAEAMAEKVRQFGRTRAAMSSCMTCWTSLSHHRPWDGEVDPVVLLLAREVGRVVNRHDDAVRLGRELRALIMLAEAHPDEFADLLRDLAEVVSLSAVRRSRVERGAG
jgi:hypothetical protein